MWRQYLLFIFVASLSIGSTIAQQELLWSDEFDDGTLNRNVWSYDTDDGPDGQLQEYTRDNVRESNAHLVITVEEDKTFWDWLTGKRKFTSGRIHSAGNIQLKYGRIEARLKVPNPANGLWPSVSLLGANVDTVGWPNSGSMTLMQMGSAEAIKLGQANSRVGSAIHWERNGQAKTDSDEFNAKKDLAGGFHTYAMDWTPTSITTFVDDVPILTKDISASACPNCDEFHHPYFLIFSVAVGGAFTGITNAGDVTASFPAEMKVDYVKIFDNGHTELSGSAAATRPPPSTAAPTIVAPTTAAPTTAAPTTAAPTTAAPTVSPTAAPTTASPTESPTTAAPDITTEEPPSTKSPTTAPVDETTEIPIQKIKAEGIKMTFDGMEPLNPDAVSVWTETTKTHLAKVMMEAIESSVVKVNVMLVSQNPPYVEKRGLRLLEDQSDTPLEITFDADFAIQSAKQIKDINTYITNAFADNGKKATYLEQLQQVGGSPFDGANSVSVESAETVSNESATDDNQKNEKSRVGLIVGIAAAAMVLLVSGLFLYARRWRKNRSATEKQQQPPESAPSKSRNAAGKSSVATRQELEQSAYATEPVDEESLFASHLRQKVAPITSIAAASLPVSFVSEAFRCEDAGDDPLVPPRPLGTTADDIESHGGFSSTVSSIDADYNFRHAYWNVENSVVGDGESTITDERTVCEEFTIHAPKGKLGLVIKMSNDGCPAIFEIKPHSPLKGKVQVGDRLHSVDGHDVTMVMAETVARVIASKEHANTRVFVFARPLIKE